MSRIVRVRPVLLSAPYGDPASSAENRLHLPSGLRTCGLIELTLADGTVGLGEAYLAVFAPKVFESIVDLLAPMLLGRDARDVTTIVRDMVTATGYWSFQGAARHVVGAVETALLDAGARQEGVPLWKHLGAASAAPLPAYASGGDSLTPDTMAAEVESVAALGISTFKIRARAHQVEKVAWTQRHGAAAGVQVAVDMTQNLVVPSQSPSEVLEFLARVDEASGAPLAFLEEALGPDRVEQLPLLCSSTTVRVAGGEIVTTPEELAARLRVGSYDIVQPDATVIGGIRAVLSVFTAAKRADALVYVHCWGGAVGVTANYHAAVAGGGPVVEWPMPAYPLRSALLDGVLSVRGGEVVLQDLPGLGIELTSEIEREYAFRPEAVYDCVPASTVAGHATHWA